MGALLHQAAAKHGYMYSSKVEVILNVPSEQPAETDTIGFGDPSDHLTPRQIVYVAATISVDDMKTIAEGYMNINHQMVSDLRRNLRHSKLEFNRRIIRLWIEKTLNCQKQVCLKVMSKIVEIGFIVEEVTGIQVTFSLIIEAGGYSLLCCY